MVLKIESNVNLEKLKTLFTSGIFNFDTQAKILKEIENNNLIINASPNFGKTCVISKYIMDSFINDKNSKHLIIVPTELLESQILFKLQSQYSKYKIELDLISHATLLFVLPRNYELKFQSLLRYKKIKKIIN